VLQNTDHRSLITRHFNHIFFPASSSNRLPISVTLDQAIQRLYDLHPGVTPVEEGAPHERPSPLFRIKNQKSSINIHQSNRRRLGNRQARSSSKHNEPSTKHSGEAAALIDPRRSNGEKEIAEIAGKSVLLPKDPAFHPEAEGLRWRIEKLTA